MLHVSIRNPGNGTTVRMHAPQTDKRVDDEHIHQIEKKPHTSGAMINARRVAPYCLSTAIMLTKAVAVEAGEIPPDPALMTLAA